MRERLLIFGFAISFALGGCTCLLGGSDLMGGDAGLTDTSGDVVADVRDVGEDATRDTSGDTSNDTTVPVDTNPGCSLGTLEHCGSCDDLCEASNATPECVMNTCRVASCDDGFLDCNEADDDGCEQAVDDDNCGECGKVCRGSNVCVEGVCQDPVVDVTMERNPMGTRGVGCVTTESGRVRCWGDNSEGQVPGVEATLVVRPTEVGDGFVSVDCGYFYCCGVTTDRTVQCWGRDEFGTLGDGGVDSSRDGIVDVSGATGVIAVSTGTSAACARSSTSLRCWGLDIGSLAVLRDVQWNTSTEFDLGVRDVSIGHTHGCHRKRDGRTYCWGANFYGQLGDETFVSRRRPTAIGEMNLRSIQVGQFHSCAITTAADVMCWGRGEQGQLGYEAEVENSVPRVVPGISDVSQIEVGTSETCAQVDDRLWCWGTFGDLVYEGPTEIEFDFGEIEDFAVSSGSACVVNANGVLYCWGANDSGQLGVGEPTDEPERVPVRVQVP